MDNIKQHDVSKNPKVVLFLCNLTDIIAKPWVDAGYYAILVDTQHDGEKQDGRIFRSCCDVRNYKPPAEWEYAFVAAFPPCTHTAVSGARWFKAKGPKAAVEAFSILAACIEICESLGAPWMIENPVSTFSTYWRKPDYTFDPCDYGGYLDPPSDKYTKKTCLWVGNGFVMPPPKPVQPEGKNPIHYMPPSKERSNLRSVTSAGFAKAVFEYNSGNKRTQENIVAPNTKGFFG